MITLRTERLLLRPWTLDDAPDALRIYGDPRVTRFIGGHTVHGEAEMRDQLADRIALTARYAEGLDAWAAVLQVPEDDQGGRVVGCGLLKPLPRRGMGPTRELTDDIEVGWHLAHDVWGRGLATEIGRALVAHGVGTLGLADIHAVVEPDNAASMRVAERVGLTHVGRTTAYYDAIELEHFRLRPARG